LNELPKAAREKLLWDAGINVRNNSGRFVSPVEIIEQLAKEWYRFSDDEQDMDK